jgi:hypothetical protein
VHPKMEIQNFHFGFSTLFYIHFGISTNFPGFLAGFYKTLNPNDLPVGEFQEPMKIIGQSENFAIDHSSSYIQKNSTYKRTPPYEEFV